MMQFVIFGAGKFGRAILEGLRNFDDVQTTLFEQNEQLINQLRPYINQAISVDLNLNLNLVRYLPDKVDAVIIDLGKNIETTLKVIHDVCNFYQNSPRIIVATDNPKLSKIYEMFGVNEVIVPNVEAANHLLPFLISRLIYFYIPIGKNFVMAEIGIPEDFHHKTFRDLNLRSNYGLNVVAIRPNLGDYELFDLDYKLDPSDHLLVVGTTENINGFLDVKKEVTGLTFKKLVNWFENMRFGKKPSESK